MPSGDVRVDIWPTATRWVPVQTIEKSHSRIPDFLGVQVIPSGDVRIIPCDPTATSWEPVQIMEDRKLDIPKVLVVQTMPSGEVIMTPLSPMATSWVPVQVNDFNGKLVG